MARDPIKMRDKAQEDQLEAQQEGDIGKEMKNFVKEVVADQMQFPRDVKADAKNPDRRLNDQQGTAEHPAQEPGG